MFISARAASYILRPTWCVVWCILLQKARPFRLQIPCLPTQSTWRPRQTPPPHVSRWGSGPSKWLARAWIPNSLPMEKSVCTNYFKELSISTQNYGLVQYIWKNLHKNEHVFAKRIKRRWRTPFIVLASHPRCFSGDTDFCRVNIG